jgi:proline iminopeptidase
VNTAKSYEGRLAVDARSGYEIFFRSYGQGPVTLVGLHGGPGGDHKPLMRLSELADETLRVVLYDQLGSGLSDRPDDSSLWSVHRFVEELETIRGALDLGTVFLLGQSWGGMLALQYVLDHPENVGGLILSNTGASAAEISRGMLQLRTQLPGPEFAAMLKCEAQGDYTSSKYMNAVMSLYSRHLRRATPFSPDNSITEFKEVMEPLMTDMGPAYNAMWGPNEFVCTGTLIDWDVTDRLGEIKAPCLVLGGWYDEVAVSVQRVLATEIPDTEFIIFGQSSHVTILEKEGDAYLDVIRGFVKRKCQSGTIRQGEGKGQ